MGAGGIDISRYEMLITPILVSGSAFSAATRIIYMYMFFRATSRDEDNAISSAARGRATSIITLLSGLPIVPRYLILIPPPPELSILNSVMTHHPNIWGVSNMPMFRQCFGNYWKSGGQYLPADTINVGLPLVHCLQRLTNAKSTLIQRLVLLGLLWIRHWMRMSCQV